MIKGFITGGLAGVLFSVYLAFVPDVNALPVEIDYLLEMTLPLFAYILNWVPVLATGLAIISWWLLYESSWIIIKITLLIFSFIRGA